MDESLEKAQQIFDAIKALFGTVVKVVEASIKLPILNHKIDRLKQDIKYNKESSKAEKKQLTQDYKALKNESIKQKQEIIKQVLKAEPAKQEPVAGKKSLTARMAQAKQKANEHNQAVAPQQKGITLGMSR